MRPFYWLQRLYVDEPLNDEKSISLNQKHIHYLFHVLRMKEGQDILIFNGYDGEWRARVLHITNKVLILKLLEQTRPQPVKKDIVFCFSPLKQGRLDYLVQKAVEMGATILQPVQTQHTQRSYINNEKIKANAFEACEQCGSLTVPQCFKIIPLKQLIASWEQTKYLIFCDESKAGQKDQGFDWLSDFKKRPKEGIGLLIGPEGGFSQQEKEYLYKQSFVETLSLGPRILRSDTAAVVALTVLNIILGDWL